MVERNTNEKKYSMGVGVALGFAIGAALGVVVGEVSGDIALWLSVGVGAGVAFGVAIGDISKMGGRQRISGCSQSSRKVSENPPGLLRPR